MKPDEGRDEEAFSGLLFRDFLANETRARALYDDLRQREARATRRLTELEVEVVRLQRAEQDSRALRRRLGTANAALDAYRTESRRLKADLKRVRGSNAYRVGRAVLRPVGILRRLRGGPGGGHPITRQ